MENTIKWIITFLQTLNEILTATVAITTFSLFLFILFFIRKEKLARIFAPLLFFLTVIYSADALENTTILLSYQLYWQKIHWTGFVFLPAIFFHFSEVLLTMTGFSQQKLRKILIVFIYCCSLFFLIELWTDRLFSGMRKIETIGSTMIPAETAGWFWIFFGILLVSSFLNYLNTYSRTRTRTSRRRMTYLIFSSIGVLLGTFPLLIFGSGFVSQHPLFFWIISNLANFVILIMVLLLGYSVTTFCVSWSYRVVRLRLFEWMLRGPATASATLGILTLIKRSSGVLGINIDGLISLLTVVSIVMLEFLITLILPLMERNSISGYGNEDYSLVSGLENMVVFKPELNTYLESLISAVTDKFQAKGAFIAVIDPMGKIDDYIQVGEADWENISEIPARIFEEKQTGEELILDDSGVICPIISKENSNDASVLLAILGISGTAAEELDDDNRNALQLAIEKARVILWQRWYLISALSVLRSVNERDQIGLFRDVSPLNQTEMLKSRSKLDLTYVSGWVRDALTHYWGGPRLSENPLMDLEIVRNELNHEADSPTNALRSVLKAAIERIRPAGERNISGEWILYNILELKFIEGKKVKEVAQKLAISEADLYRKQKVAIEEIAKTLIRMEDESSYGTIEKSPDNSKE
jgi:hypothetical protein